MIKRILLVDDDIDIRDVTQVALQKFAGWDVVTAASGLEGLDRARTERFDVILLDVSMPEMDGLTMFKRLQTDLATQQVPVVLLTAKSLPSDRRRFAEIGVVGAIAKPFNPVTISAQIAELLGWV